MKTSFKYRFIILLSVLFLLFVSKFSLASITGIWDISISEQLTLKIKGLKTEKEITNLSEKWEFYENGFFDKTDGLQGFWIQKGRKYIIFLNVRDTVEKLVNLLTSKGFNNTTVNTTEQFFIIKKKKNETLKGKFIIKADIVFESGDTGKIKIKGKFTGTPDKTSQSVPTSPSAVANSSTQINLLWDTSADKCINCILLQ